MAAGAAWTIWAYVPAATPLSKADVIVVLGHPALPDGSPGPAMEEEIVLAAWLYAAGLAPNLILTGGAVHNEHVEAEVMAGLAHRLGVPLDRCYADGWARDTIENAANTSRLMREHGWRRAILVTTPYHARRASATFKRFEIAHQVAYPANSHELGSLGRRAKALAYELVGYAWLLASGPCGLRPFWARRHRK